MCLQSILEGKGYFIKKTGEFIKTTLVSVIATANTKGKGSDDGRFIGTNVMNEAFLERFPITVEQEYPPLLLKRKYLVKYLLTWVSLTMVLLLSLLIGLTLSEKLSMMVVLTKSSQQED